MGDRRGGGGKREKGGCVCVCDRERDVCVPASLGPSPDGRENGALLAQQR